MIEIKPVIGYRRNLMFIVNAKNTFGTRLAKKFSKLEPNSV